MNPSATVTQKQLLDFLLHVAIVRPVFIWGAPGIGKSSIVQQFAEQVGLACVSLLGSQLAPEDLIGVPQIVDGRSIFCPPRTIGPEIPGGSRTLPRWTSSIAGPCPRACNTTNTAGGACYRRDS